MTRRSRPRPLPVAVMAAALVANLAALLVSATPAMAVTFANTTPITTTDPATCESPILASNPYPSPIVVSGMTGTVSDVNVTLHGMNHWRGDFEVLLVGPGGGAQNLVVLSDTGTGDVANFTLTLDDEAAAVLPAAGSWPAAGKPTDYAELTRGDAFPAPAPAPANRPAPAGTATLVSVFDGIDPNGTWNLFVVTDACDDPAETITGGWSLDITTSVGAATTTVVTSAPNPSTTGQSVTFAATVTSGGNPVATGTVTFSEGATTLATNVALNSSGQATFSTSTLAEGNHVVTATYNGVAAFSTSNGSVNHRANNPTAVNGNVYCNAGPIAIKASPNPATPYASNIFVSGFAGNLTDVDVTLKNVSHQFPDDVNVLLVGPGGQNLVVVSDAGNPGGPGGDGAVNVTAVFDDEATGQLAQNVPWGAPGSTVSSRPIDYEPIGDGDAFPAPAPAPSPATALSTFDNTNPNGTWSLYVVSDGAPETGTIAGGWCLTLSSAPPDPDVVVTKADSPDPVVAGANLTYTIGVSNSVAGSTAEDLVLTDVIPADTTFVSLASAGGWTCNPLPAVGSAGGTVTCTRATLTQADGNQAFTLVVRVDTHAPAGTPVSNTASVAASTPDGSSGNNQAPATTAVTFARSLPAVVTGSTNWSLRNSLTMGSPTSTFVYGTTPLVPLMGDWDGDGTKTAGTYEAGRFKLRNANSGGPPDLDFAFGDRRGFPVAGDWNGDGLDDVAVYRNGTWQTRLTGSGATDTFTFGAGNWPATVPLAGDWDGNGADGIGTYTASTGTWNLRNTASPGGTANAGSFVYNPGTSPYPVVGDWNGDGIDTVGVKTGTTPAQWLLNNQNDGSAPDVTFEFGLANDLPLTWRQLSTP